MASPDIIHRVIFAGKIAGAIGAIGAFGYGALRWLFSVVHSVTDIRTNVTLLTENHLPHIQESLSAQSQALQGIKSDVRDLDTKITGTNQRLEDTRDGMHRLGQSFLAHVEAATKEIPPPRKRKR